MSYRPNNPAITKRSPQHGVHVAGSSQTSQPSTTTSLSSSSTSSWTAMPQTNTVTVNCAKTGCTNTATTVPHGHNNDQIHIRVRCKECYVPAVIEITEKKEDKVVVMWDAEEWADVQQVEEHEQ